MALLQDSRPLRPCVVLSTINYGSLRFHSSAVEGQYVLEKIQQMNNIRFTSDRLRIANEAASTGHLSALIFWFFRFEEGGQWNSRGVLEYEENSIVSTFPDCIRHAKFRGANNNDEKRETCSPSFVLCFSLGIRGHFLH